MPRTSTDYTDSYEIGHRHDVNNDEPFTEVDKAYIKSFIKMMIANADDDLMLMWRDFLRSEHGYDYVRGMIDWLENND
jgi:hypothetical protein